jgi:hypothetical protein
MLEFRGWGRVWGGGKNGGWGKSVASYPARRRPQEFISKLLVLISDSFPGMETFRVRTAAGQVGEYLRAELCRGAWGGQNR